MAARKKKDDDDGKAWRVIRGSEQPSEGAVKDALSLLEADYWGDIRSNAKDVIRQIKDGEISSRDELYERLNEEADGTQWVIYTHQARVLLVCTNTPDAYEEEFGEKPDTVEKQAYAAYLHDLTEQVEAEGDIDALLRGESDEDDED